MRVLALLREDLRLTLRDRSSIFWIFIAPFLWVYFFGALVRPSDPAKTQVSLGIVQEDASRMAGRFVDQLRSENFRVKVFEPGEPIPAGDDGPARLLTIPAGFGEAIGMRRKVKLDLRQRDNAGPEGTFTTQVALHKGIVRLLAGEALGGLEPEEDLVRVRSSWAGVRATPAGLYQSIPGNLVMFVLISTMTYGAALLALERRTGLLRRLESSPLSRAEIIGGKLLGRAAVAAVQVSVFLLIGLAIFRIDWGSSPVGLALLILSYIFCAGALGLLAGTLFTSPAASSGLGTVVVLLMSALGGCWWPAEVMPDWMRAASYALPTAWAMDGLHHIISWGGGVREVLLHCLVLSLFAVAAGTLAARRLRALSRT